MLAESDSTPMFMGAMPKIVKGVMSILRDDIHDGDVILHNDPYLGATHSPDVAIVMPIFFDGRARWVLRCVRSPLDIGGAYPGLAVDLVDNWSEGNIYRAVKLADRGVCQDGLWRHILENTRTATHNQGDIQAMIAACEFAKRRFSGWSPGTGGRRARRGAEWIAYSERMLRQEIAKIPDGVYETESGWLDDDGRNRGIKLPVNVKVVIAGDEITIDLTGSSDEVPTGYNCPFEGTTVIAMYLHRSHDLPGRGGVSGVRPPERGHAQARQGDGPQGSIFNPHYPRACFARFCQVQRAVDLVLRALAPSRAARVTAGNSAHFTFISYSGFIPTRASTGST